ncbi:MAG: AAA family ATPase [Planctomycetes bacterium]|nr:AAA family ATPase [Planctomycetota bacterium]
MSRDLFEELDGSSRPQPLAARMRPRRLDDFVGQDHILGSGRLLRRAIEADQLSSLIFYGPPGTGKTTLARIIAEQTNSCFMSINAVLAGVKDIRAAIERAGREMDLGRRRSILFLDEVHRFNKAQQDALLPHVENGTLILIGATTENPYFEVNKALVSRSRIFCLNPLLDEDLDKVLVRALSDADCGYGKLAIRIDDDARKHLVKMSQGDARSLLNALELAVEPERKERVGEIHISLAIAEESIQRRAVLYDKDGDAHFDTISAFIKSLRGSDPDAALYWLAKMLEAGEDPRFIFRRMIIAASEDVGLAAPELLSQVVSAAQAYDYIGLPEGAFPLAQACLLIATAPKSNSTLSLFDAMKEVRRQSRDEVPDHLKDASRDGEDLGHGKDYKYPHAYRDHWVNQQYLPDGLKGMVFYHPSEQGAEGRIRDEVFRRREAGVAAMRDPDLATGHSREGSGPWVERTLSDATRLAAWVRDHLLEEAELEPAHVALDLNAGSGLVTLELLRRLKGGEVWSVVLQEGEVELLQALVSGRDSLKRPRVLHCPVQELRELPSRLEGMQFDRIFMRSLMRQAGELPGFLKLLRGVLSPSGRVVVFQYLPHLEQRLGKLLEERKAGGELLDTFIAEEEVYFSTSAPMITSRSFAAHFESPLSGYHCLHMRTPSLTYRKTLTPILLEEWLSPRRPCGAFLQDRRGESFSGACLTMLKTHLGNRECSWQRTALLALLVAVGPGGSAT